MFSIVYRSIASPAFDKAKIKEMIERARRFNKKNHITGCLLFYNGEFVQYLEGKQVTILRLFDKIKIDDRHHDVELISHSHIKGREFEKWDMAYEDFLGENDELQFLRLLVSSYFESPLNVMEPNPASSYFWSTTRRLLQSKSSHKYL